MVAVNYVGEELWSFYNAPWETRVDLARQLMDIAEQLTNNDFDFALYLLDVSFDNFAVGPRDGKVIVVDAENVLVADKRLIRQSKSLLDLSVCQITFFYQHVSSLSCVIFDCISIMTINNLFVLVSAIHSLDKLCLMA